MAALKPHTLSDGTTIRVIGTRGLIGTEFREVPSRKRRTSGNVLWMDGSMYYLGPDNRQMIRITADAYRYASTPPDAARVALTFFVAGAESCIAEAARESLPVEAMYGPLPA